MQLQSTISLNQLKIYAYHGCYAEEQIVGNWFLVDLSLDVNAGKAAESDNIADALNYVETYEIVRREMAIKSHLLENVAMRICMALRAAFDSEKLIGGTLKIAKLAPPVGGEMHSVSVTMRF